MTPMNLALWQLELAGCHAAAIKLGQMNWLRSEVWLLAAAFARAYEQEDWRQSRVGGGEDPADGLFMQPKMVNGSRYKFFTGEQAHDKRVLQHWLTFARERYDEMARRHLVDRLASIIGAEDWNVHQVLEPRRSLSKALRVGSEEAHIECPIV
jgi:hypothetical protein